MWVPIPSSPKLLNPQHFTPPTVVRAHVASPPAATTTTPFVRPLTSAGTVLSVVVPSPSSPNTLRPQHLIPPVVVRAQVWLRSADTAAMPLVRPLTSTDVEALVLVPLPSCPSVLSPQHFTPPAAMRAHECLNPALIATTPPVRPDTSTGVARSMIVPSPNWPTSFRPQHLTPPAVVRTHVFCVPAETDATPLVRPGTSNGLLLFVVVPLPNWPKPLAPQHLTPPVLVRAQVWSKPAETAATIVPDADAERWSVGQLLATATPRPLTSAVVSRAFRQCMTASPLLCARHLSTGPASDRVFLMHTE